MKILHIEDFFHPNAGYQLNVLAKFMARDKHQVTIVTSEMDKMPKSLTEFFGTNNIKEQDKKFETAYGIKIIRLPLYTYISGRSIYNCSNIWNVIEDIQPDIVYVHGNDTYVAIRVFLHHKHIKCPIITDSHMVDIASTNKFRKVFRSLYKKFITPIIIKNNITVIRTADDEYVFKRLGIPLEQAPVISLGSDTMLFKPNLSIKESFKNENNISKEAFIILYAGKLNEAKGALLLGQLTNTIIKTKREIVFLIIGNTVGDYGKRVEDLFKTSRYRIIRFPTQSYSELGRYYQAADIAVMPRQCSLSIFDFSATGLPVIAEDNPVNINRIEDLAGGSVFKEGDVVSLGSVIAQYANLDSNAFSVISKKLSATASEKYGYDKQYKKYMDTIEKAIYNYQKIF